MNSAKILSLYSHVSRWANENQGVLAILIPSLLLLFGWASGLLKRIRRWASSIYLKVKLQHNDIDFVIRRGTQLGSTGKKQQHP